jgi:hypothetical protein
LSNFDGLFLEIAKKQTNKPWDEELSAIVKKILSDGITSPKISIRKETLTFI